MNKELSILKSFSILLVTVLSIIFVKNNGMIGNTYFTYISIEIIFALINAKDYIKKNKIQFNNIYNIISMVVLLLISLIFIRTYFDKNILLETAYLYQNLWIFIILIILLIIYRKINMEKEKSNYHIVSIICLLISMCTVFPSIDCLYNGNVYLYLLFTLLLIAVECYRLYKDNYKCKNWPIFISFIFNTFALICIFINFII